MRKICKPLSMLLALVLLATTATFSVLSATNDYNSSGADIEVEATSAYTNSGESYNTYSGNDLGAVYSKNSTTFKVWAPSATKVQLKLYNTGSDSETGAGVIGTYDMSKDSTNGVWSITQSGDLNGKYYTYLVTVNGTTKETRDVYANAAGVNGRRSMVVDLSSTDPDGWSNDRHILFDNAPEAAVWEVSVRDFSIDSTSGVDADKRGKYMAFTQHGTTLNGAGVLKTGIDYLIENNINCVQIMPMYDFGSVDETKGGQNWGYDPMNYNVPEGSFSSNPYDGAVRIKELKSMIKALHDAGISVIMDVVYNHTYNTSDSAFENTVPGYYYRMNGSTFLNGSGCGNVTASDKTMYRKYMIDSVKYWANEYHIDGFRFDLMGCHDYTTMNNIRAELDKIDKRIIMYGEPWMADWGGGNGIANSSAAIMDNASKLNPRVGCFNDKMRNALKGGTSDKSSGFIQGSTSSTADVKAGCMAHTSSILGKWSQAPSQTVTYNSCHDNLTLWDKILYSQGSTDYNGSNGTFLAMNKLSAALVLTSQGVAFTQAGEEFARTKRGDENSYNTGDAVNKIDWTRISQYSSLREYYKGLRLIRQVYSPFTDGTNTSVGQSYFSGSESVIAYTMQNKTANAANEWGTVAVIANNSTSTQSVTLKASTTLPTSWATIVNGSSAGLKNLGTVTGTTISVPGRTAMVLVDLASFNEKNIQGPTTTVPTTSTPANGTVTWNTTKIKGFADGVAYEDLAGSTSRITKTVVPEDGYEIAYVKIVTGGADVTSTAYNSATGTIDFTRNGNAEITLIATKIPSTHLYGDANEDGKINVRDVTTIQKYICNPDDSLSDVGKKASNVNGDEGIDVQDATVLQKYVSKYITSLPVGESFSDEKPTFTIPTETTTSTTATVPTSTQTSPTNPSGSITVNFVSNVDNGKERWAAYCWTDTNNMWFDVVNGQVTVPSSMENIIFVRFDGTSTENKWDEEGATVKYVWNQTDDLLLGSGSTYTVTGWGDGWGAPLEGSWS